MKTTLKRLALLTLLAAGRARQRERCGAGEGTHEAARAHSRQSTQDTNALRLIASWLQVLPLREFSQVPQ